jgi:rubrerythrin
VLEISAENEFAIQDLLAAFEDETNAQAKYLAFAEKADAEQLHGAASLCRAAARSEHFHAARHARAMRQLGVDVQYAPRKAEVKSTLENMRDALESEEHEIAEMYPGVLEAARKQKNQAVIRSFTWAMEAEKSHAVLYGEAVALLEAGRSDSWIEDGRAFYVCPECGYTAETLKRDESCPVCRCSQERFEAVE